ncbi:response regulator [Phyllobacterium sp. LjRoot231]|uniref:response regulator n=1 Tax=Phyllobacterium sp. LjRoot231 TaxID=3342289 RepID=UPI003ED09964
MNQHRILIVDDEPQIQRFLNPALTASGYEVIMASTGAEAERLAATSAPDLIILDLGLPDKDGKEVIETIRAFSEVPIIVLSARDREAEKIASLDLGANDYVGKPFGIGELLARIRTALRQQAAGTSVPSRFEANGLVVDMVKRLVSRNGEEVHVTRKEYQLLVHLVLHAGMVVTHRQLLASVWGAAHVHDLQYLRVFVGQLRAKIEDDANNPQFIRTEAGVGYRFIAE